MQRFFICIFLFFLFLLTGLPELSAQDEPLVDSPYPLSGSSLALERHIRYDFNQAVEDVLKNIEKLSSETSEFKLAIEVETVEGFSVDLNRDNLGLDSYKSTLNWNPPPEGELFNRTTKLIAWGKENEFHFDRIDFEENTAEWWHKKDGYFYSSKMLDVLPFITRWRAAEALESNMIAYGEGLGLILWAFQPGEYLRTSQHLTLGEPATISGKTYLTLISTPDWIKNPPTLPARLYNPFNTSKLISWAALTPIITYYINPDTFAIEGAVFDYFKVFQSHPGRWTVIPKYRDHSLESWVTQWQVSGNRKIPKTIEGKYIVDEELKRQITFSVSEKEKDEMPQLVLDSGRRVFESFPPFQSAVYKNRIQTGKIDYANRVGFVDALAFEGDLATALIELKTLVKDFQTDQNLTPESTAGIDWHLGYAVYEFLQRDESPEYSSIWNDFEPKEPYASILARACDFYARWHRNEKISFVEDHFNMYKSDFGVKAKIMHSLGRTLERRVEKETIRGLEIQESLKQAGNDALRLTALKGAVEAYIRDNNFQKAWEVMDLAETLLEKPESIEVFNTLKEQWELRIAEKINERDKREWEAEVQSKKDLYSQLKSRAARAAHFRSQSEVNRLNKIIGKLEEELESINQDAINQ